MDQIRPGIQLSDLIHYLDTFTFKALKFYERLGLHRMRGEVLLKRDPAAPDRAEEAFRTAIAIAKEQGARSPILLASLALAKLCQSTGRPVEAHRILAPAIEGFTPTPEMPEIAEAQALLVAIEAGAQVRRE